MTDSLDSTNSQTQKQRLRCRKSPEERGRLREQHGFSSVTSAESLMAHLQANSNAYNSKILEYKERLDLTKPERQDLLERMVYNEQHHIIPLSAGGEDELWNLLLVTTEEHRDLHKLRFEVTQSRADWLAWKGREDLSQDHAQIRRERSRLGHETQKRLGLSFYNSEVQRENRRRGAAAGKTLEREKAFRKQCNHSKRKLLEKDLCFHNLHTDKIFHVPGGTFKRPGEIRIFLLENSNNNSENPIEKRDYETLTKQENFTTGINKVLNKYIPNASNKNVRNRFAGWSVFPDV
jgi:5-methylcytosine-specific restriction endonuclease McrA